MALVSNGRVDLTPLVTHRFSLDDLPAAFELFSRQASGVMKVGIYPAGVPAQRNPVRETAHVER
jgi:threonine dehydrogenase-like Zn-dependent dehydrogenase